LITPTWDEDLAVPHPPVMFRCEFDAPGDVVCARLYATAHGTYTAEFNGAAVSDALLAPGWSAYRKRLRFQTHDVTPLLVAGRNAIGITVADGWYRGYLGWDHKRNFYGDRSAVLAQLELTRADGSIHIVATDPSWRAGRGPIRESDLYMGESYDARLEAEVAGWSTARFDDGGWEPTSEMPLNRELLTGQVGPPVRCTEELAPVARTASPATGAVIFDFGQNLVGKLRLKQPKVGVGETVTIRHAEVLSGGELCVEPLRTALQTDRFTGSGDVAEAWEPIFTSHGFRYAEISGWPGATAEDVAALVCHSDMTRIGWFSCSDPLLNRLHENAVWSMRGNFVDVPTDCPQRDERLGWTGDLQAFAPSAAFLYDCASLLDSWLADLAAEQDDDGGIPFVVPNPMPPDYRFASNVPAGWGDAAIVVPWVTYLRFGDVGLLERQFSSMAGYLDACITNHGPDLNPELFQFGDWLDPAAPPDKPSDGQTDPLLVAGAYLVHAADIVTAAAEIVGRVGDQGRYAAHATHYRDVWRRRFIGDDGTFVNDSATAHALAICFQLLGDDEAQAAAGRRLAELIAAAGHRISTGFLGTPLVCDALTTTGHLETAYALLLQRECPSWLYPVLQGATTIWERWDSLTPSGEVNDPKMTSFNHYALGAVVDWMHRTIGGLSPADAGYRTHLIRPLPGGDLTSATVRHLTAYGEISVAWRLSDTEFGTDLTIPPATSAVVDLPIAGWQIVELGSGQHSFLGEFEIRPLRPTALPTGAFWSAAERVSLSQTRF
jgi:alpha-L-rhamnosidase